jgi:hypothetical protein
MVWTTSNLTDRTGAPLATFGPTAYLFAQFTRHVVYQGFTFEGGSDGRLYELYVSEDGVWHYTDMMAEADAPLATAYPTGYIFASEGTQHVLYEGQLSDGHVHELWWDGNWHHNDLTVASGAPDTLTAPSGYEFHTDGTEHVVFQGIDNHVHELAHGTGSGPWTHTDLTASFGGPLADAAPGGYAFESQQTQHVNYRSRDGHINEFWKDASGWHTSGDLSAEAGAPPAADDGHKGYIFEAQATQHIDYNGVDGDIHELWWQDGLGWQHNNLTGSVGAIKASAGFRPTSYAWESEGRQPVATQHVDYVGQDDFVHELWWNPTGWHFNELTGRPGTFPSISSPTAFVEVDQGTQNIYYNSDSHQIVQLQWTN